LYFSSTRAILLICICNVVLAYENVKTTFQEEVLGGNTVLETGMLPLEPATPDEARKMLNLKGLEKVNF
jgi:hypothetical protein